MGGGVHEAGIVLPARCGFKRKRGRPGGGAPSQGKVERLA